MSHARKLLIAVLCAFFCPGIITDSFAASTEEKAAFQAALTEACYDNIGGCMEASKELGEALSKQGLGLNDIDDSLESFMGPAYEALQRAASNTPNPNDTDFPGPEDTTAPGPGDPVEPQPTGTSVEVPAVQPSPEPTYYLISAPQVEPSPTATPYYDITSGPEGPSDGGWW